jgi:hypothetical protein
MTLHPIPLNFLIYRENYILFFISVGTKERGEGEEEFAVFLLSTTLFLRFTKMCYKISLPSQTTLQPFFASLYIVLYVSIFRMSLLKLFLLVIYVKEVGSGCYCSNTVPSICRPSLLCFVYFCLLEVRLEQVNKNIYASCLLC